MKKYLKLSFLAASVALGGCSSKQGHSNGSKGSQPQRSPNNETSGPTDGLNPQATQAQQPEGTITSGGGYVYGYEANPWFIGNTKIVNYCVDMDEGNFGASREAAEKSIILAISHWQGAFTNASFNGHRAEPAGILILGTQEFKKVDCSTTNIDIRFQLGKLSPEQARLLGNPRKFVASTVQTDYDSENMRGKGFIYVAPEKGALRPDADDIADSFWTYSDNFHLEVALTHEMGHVFGIPHSEKNFPMGATICEEIITKKSQISTADPTHFLRDLYGSWSNFAHDLMSSLYNSRRGTSYLSSQETKEVFGFSFNDNENSAELVFENNNVIVYSVHQEIDNPIKRTRLRALSKFEVLAESEQSGALTNIRIPRNQKIMTIPAGESHDGAYLGGSYQMLSFLQYYGSSQIEGFIIDLTSGKKTYVKVSTIPDEGSFQNNLLIEIVVDGKIKKLSW